MTYFAPELSRARGQLHSGQPARDAGARSCPNGISGRSTRSCAPSRSTSSCRRSCGACWRCSARSCCCSSCRGSTSSPVRSGSYRPVFKRFFWLLVVDVIILGWAGGGAPTPMRNVDQPARRGLLFPPLPRDPAARFGLRDAASAAALDQRFRASRRGSGSSAGRRASRGAPRPQRPSSSKGTGDRCVSFSDSSARSSPESC